MARIRSIKPEFWVDRKLARATSRDARMLYVGLWNFADEHARLIGDPDYLKGQIFPYEEDLDAVAVKGLLDELVAFGVAVPYVAHDEVFLYLPTLAKHQRLQPEKVASKHPDHTSVWINPDATQIGSDKSVREANQTPETSSPQVSDLAQILPDESVPRTDPSALLYGAGSMEHVAGSMVSPRKRGTTLPEDFAVSDGMRVWAATEIPLVDVVPQTAKFRDFHTAKGSTFKDWTAAWRTWMRNAQTFAERDGRGVAVQRPPVSTDLEWMRS